MSMGTQTKTKAKVRPTGNRLLVKRSEAKDKTKGGIILPDTSKEKPRLGTVLEAGPGVPNERTGAMVPPEAQPGNKIIFSSYAGTEIKIEGEEFLIIESGDVLAIIEDDSDIG